MHPQPRMQNKTKHTSVVTTGSPESYRHSLRDGLTVTPWSPRCAGLVSHRRLRKSLSANLTPASGCQAPTAWPPASTLPVSQRARVHRIPPRVRDSREPPLLIEAGPGNSSSDL